MRWGTHSPNCPGLQFHEGRKAPQYAGIAQLVERRLCNPQVTGSNPVPSSSTEPERHGVMVFSSSVFAGGDTGILVASKSTLV